MFLSTEYLFISGLYLVTYSLVTKGFSNVFSVTKWFSNVFSVTKWFSNVCYGNKGVE